MGQPYGSMQRPGGAPTSRPWPNRPRADPIAAAILLIAGAIGIWQLLLPWRTIGPEPGGPAVSTTGWQIYRVLRVIPDPDGEIRAAMLAVLGVGVGGGALVVLGIAMMFPINHRPLGLAALLISILAIVGAGWMLIRSRTIFEVGLFGLFAQAQIGWYLFLATGLVGLVGSWKALATG